MEIAGDGTLIARSNLAGGIETAIVQVGHALVLQSGSSSAVAAALGTSLADSHIPLPGIYWLWVVYPAGVSCLSVADREVSDVRDNREPSAFTEGDA